MGVPGGRDSEGEGMEMGQKEALTRALGLLKKAEEGESLGKQGQNGVNRLEGLSLNGAVPAFQECSWVSLRAFSWE